MDWMHLLFAAAATGFGGLAWGYRTQAANEREQVTYLRKQLQTPAPIDAPRLPAPNPTSTAFRQPERANG